MKKKATNTKPHVAAKHTAKTRFKNLNWLILPLLITGISMVAAGIVLAVPKNEKILQKNSKLQIAVDLCEQQQKLTYDCYREELGGIVSKSTPEDAMALVKSQYQTSSFVKSQCHQLTHMIGRAALDKYNGDLTNTFKHGSDFCWAGYYHGAIEQLAKTKGNDYILQNANNICSKIAAKERYSFYHFNCVHGLGHGFMMIQDDELFTSLASCDKITDDWERTSCFGGVFMQNIMDDQPELGIYSKYLKKDQPMYPCTAVDEQYKQQCYLMQTSYALNLVGGDFSKVFELCAGVDADYQATCYQSTGRDASGRSVSDVAQTKATCLLGPSADAQANCVIGAVKDFISYFHSDQQAAQLCDSFTQDLQNICKTTAKEYYSTF